MKVEEGLIKIITEQNKLLETISVNQAVMTKMTILLAKIHDPDGWQHWFGRGVKLKKEKMKEIEEICEIWKQPK